MSLGRCGNPSIKPSLSGGTDVARGPGSLTSSLQGLDDRHAVDALVDQLLVDVGLSRHDAELVADAKGYELALGPVRDSRDEPAG